MKSINSLSGGKTSSYMAIKYPTDYNIFALVRTTDKKCLFPDEKVRQIVSDKINADFIGTVEDDMIIYTMLDLEQNYGLKIEWVTGLPFDELIKKKKDFLPNDYTRYCTVEMKIIPIANWCYNNIELPVSMQIGYRANEGRRRNIMVKREVDGIEPHKFKVGEKNGRNKWKILPYRKCSFPLIDNGIFKDNIVEFWDKHTDVRFAKFNNCVGCFNQNVMLLKHRSEENAVKYEWFASQERKIGYKSTFLSDTTYDKIRNKRLAFDLFDNDFSDCDSGYCGI